MLDAHPDAGAGAFALFAGSFIFVREGWALVRGARTRGWRSTPGVILHSEVARDPYAGDNHRYWSPVIRYEYHAGGERREGTRISFGGRGVSNSFNGALRQVRSELAAGSVVTVWYDPERPEQAVLYPGAATGTWILASLGALVMLFGLWLLLG